MSEWSELEEALARVIARKLGHNDDSGMYWQRYALAARGIAEEFDVQTKVEA